MNIDFPGHFVEFKNIFNCIVVNFIILTSLVENTINKESLNSTITQRMGNIPNRYVFGFI